MVASQLWISAGINYDTSNTEPATRLISLNWEPFIMPRPSKSDATRESQQTLDEACVYAAKMVRDIVRGTALVKGKLVKTGRVSASKLMAAKIAIEHSLGLPKAKLYVKTGALTMKDIAELATLFDNKDGDNAQQVTQSGDNSDNNSLDNVPVIDIPTRPLTARQMKERARDLAERESN